MPADIATALKDWSTTAGSNAPQGSTLISTNLNDNFQQIQSTVRAGVASSDTIASAATTDLSTKDARFLSVTGTTAITSLGTLSAGMSKVLIFGGALTLTYNATSLILPAGASITTAAGDCCEVLSLGSGNWRCLWYQRADGNVVIGVTQIGNGTAAAPALAFAADLDTGIYRVGANALGIAANGLQVASFSDVGVTIAPATSGALTLTGDPTGAQPTILRVGATSGELRLLGGTASRAYLGGNTSNALAVEGASGHLRALGASTPVLTSGAGSGASIAGSDCAFVVSFGAGAGTTLVVSFGQTWSAAPVVVCARSSTAWQVGVAASTTSAQFTFDLAPNSGDKLHVHILGGS